MTDAEWAVFFAGVKKRAAEIEAKYRQQEGVTVCATCDHPHLGTCQVCGKDGCWGFGDMCCDCCEVEAIEMANEAYEYSTTD
jgi:hypothetical protein